MSSSTTSEAAPTQPIPTKTATALIIDDNEDNRNIVRIALQSANFIVTEYEDTLLAVSILKERTFDLLVLDLQMPLLNGEQVLRAVRSNPLHQAMMIIMLTAHSQANSVEIRENANFIMYKPINVIEFASFARRIQSGGKTVTKNE